MKKAIFEKVVSDAKVDIQQSMIDREADQLVEEYKQKLQMQGFTWEQAVEAQGYDEIMNSLKEDAAVRVKNSLVIVEFGANDFFQQISISETKKNMEQIVDKLKQDNIVVLVSTEDKQLNKLYSMLKSLAKEKNVLFINGILNEIWNDRNLFSDEVHPNSNGYKLVAEKIYKNIKHLL